MPTGSPTEVERPADREPTADRAWLWLSLALVAGLLLRLWFILHFPYISDDSLMYGGLAKNLLTRHVYGFSASGAPSLIRLPGYPLFLALCFRIFGLEHYGAVLGVQAAIDLVGCVLLAILASNMFSRRGGWTALWLGVLCPFTANYVAGVLSETLTVFCVTLTFFALERWHHHGAGHNRWLYAVAFALGYGILLRPEQGLVAAAVIPAMALLSLRQRRGKSLTATLTPVVLTAALALLPLVPWTARNWRTMHVFQPLAPRFATDPGESNPSGFQRWYRTWAIDYASTEQVYWNYDGANISIADLPDRAFDSDEQYRATDSLLNAYNQTDTASPELDLQFNAIAQQRIADDTLRYYVELPVARVLNMTFRPRDYMLPWPLEWWKFSQHRAATIEASLYALLNFAYFTFAGITLWRRRKWALTNAIVWAMLATILFRALLLLTLDNSEMRYTLEFFPVLIVFAAANFDRTQQVERPQPA
jgi:hypothetical protein